jgi:hypothetical protein
MSRSIDGVVLAFARAAPPAEQKEPDRLGPMVSLRHLLPCRCASRLKFDALLISRSCIVLLALAPLPVLAATDSAAGRAAEAQFRAANPCPTSEKAQGRCTGYVIDRVVPIACGGTEHPDNMRWITLPEAKAKARWERIGCRPGRKLVLPGEHTSVTESFALEGGGPVEATPIGTGATTAAKPEQSARAPAESAQEPEPAASPAEENWPHE